jgi:hypothetical protein
MVPKHGGKCIFCLFTFNFMLIIRCFDLLLITLNYEELHDTDYVAL